MSLEGGPRHFDNLQRVEWNGEGADPHLHSRGGFRGHASTDEILEGQAKNRQRLVDGRRFGIITRIETQDAFSRRQ